MKININCLKNRKGLTLIELLITILLMGFVFSLIATMFIQASDVFFSSTRRMSAGQKAELIQTEVAGYLRSMTSYNEDEFPTIDENKWTFKGFHPTEEQIVKIKIEWDEINEVLQISVDNVLEKDEDNFEEDLIFTGVELFNISREGNEFNLNIIVVDENNTANRNISVKSRNL